MMLRRLALAALLLAAPTGLAHAGVPSQIDAQGVLRDATGDLVDLPDATLVFRLYDAASGGELLWSETQEGVPIVMGVFDTLLPANPLTELPAAVQVKLAIGAPLWLSIQLEGQAELPRTALVSVPYAFTANRALIAAGLDCSGCIDASDINTSTFTAQHLGYAPGADDLVDATNVGGAIGQLDLYLRDHIANPDAHHPADSSGIHIRPDSVTIGTTSTKLEDGTLDLGPGANDALTAAQVATLTGGGNADLLHKHTAQSITGGMGGGACVTLYGSATPVCPTGYAQAQTGQATVPVGVFSSTAAGSASTICAAVTPSSTGSGNYVYWLGNSSGPYGYYHGGMACTVCCPAPESAIEGCYSQLFSSGAAADVNTNQCVSMASSITHTLTASPGRAYHFSGIEVWVYGSDFSPTTANWDIKITRASDGFQFARVPAFVTRRATSNGYFCSGGNSSYPAYLVQGTFDFTLTTSENLKIEIVDATTGTAIYASSSSPNTNKGLVNAGYSLKGCIETTTP
ncbi:MAG: hypothetical protein IT385_30635 [Deltaproteobacteria bacterium]|nr:hypothetical protein [Deltaproteobacteria bacterium]